MTLIKLSRAANMPQVFINSPLDDFTFSAIREACSYTVYPYDGEPYVVCLLRQARNLNWYFPQGLLTEVVQILHDMEYEMDYKSALRRPPKEIDWPWKGPKELWENQEKAVQSAMKELDNGRGVILYIPTAGGKTVSALWLAKHYGTRTLVTVHTERLVEQWKKEILKNLGAEAGIIKAKVEDLRSITVATIQTLEKKIRANPNYMTDKNFGMLICDEVHHYKAKTFWRVAMNCNAYYRIGLSATPKHTEGSKDTRTDDTKKFIGAIGKIIKPSSIDDLIENGHLVAPEFHFNISPLPDRVGNTWDAQYKYGIVENEGRNRLIAINANELKDLGYQVYIHVKHVPHGERLKRLIPEAGWIWGESSKKERDLEMHRFRVGHTHILISTLLGEGIDLPEMDALIMAGGGKSEINTIQLIGRVLRARKGKSRAIIVDYLDRGRWLRSHSEERRMTMESTFGGT